MSEEYANQSTQNSTKAGKDLTLNYEIDNGLHYEGLDYMQGSLEFLVEHNEAMVPAGQASLMIPRELKIGPELPANQQATYLAVYQAVDTIKRLGSFANKPNIREKVFELVKDTAGIPLSIDDYVIIEKHKDAEKEGLISEVFDHIATYVKNSTPDEHVLVGYLSELANLYPGVISAEGVHWVVDSFSEKYKKLLLEKSLFWTKLKWATVGGAAVGLGLEGLLHLMQTSLAGLPNGMVGGAILGAAGVLYKQYETKQEQDRLEEQGISKITSGKDPPHTAIRDRIQHLKDNEPKKLEEYEFEALVPPKQAA